MSGTKDKTIEKLSSIKSLPTIPEVMLEVSSCLKSKNHSSTNLAAIVSKDASLTTKVLTIANSPLFGLPRKVSSIELAIMLMGEQELGNIVIALSMANAVKFDDHELFSFFEYWKHSMLVATASSDICKKLKMPELTGEAFLSGMLHDLGVQLIMQYFPDELTRIVSIVQKEGLDFLEAEKQVLGCSHTEIGKFLVNKWVLPENICNVLEYHHDPCKLEGNKKLVSIVHLADIMTQEFETGEIFWDERMKYHYEIADILEFESEAKLKEFMENYRETFIAAAEEIEL